MHNIHTFSLGKKQYIIHNEGELALVMDLLASSSHAFTLHRHVIMSFDAELMEIIVTYKGLLLCMKSLDYKNRFLLLVKIGDTLSQVIGKSEHLGSILAGIPEEADKIRLIKSIRARGLMQLIFVPDDLGNILEWIFGEGERMVFGILGKEFLQHLFAYGTDIYKVFHFLSDENKDIFADILTLEFIKSRIYTAEDFFYVLKALSNEKVREFILCFEPQEIRAIVGNNTILSIFLPKITQSKEQALLQYINN